MKINFTKMHGCGNDFIIIEDFNEEIDNINVIAPKLCHRHFGIGADGLVLVKKSVDADIKMEIINSDGSYAAMCGNAIRCFSKYVWEKNIVKKDKIFIETGDGIKIADLKLKDNKVDYVTINMGSPNFNPQYIPADSKESIINKSINIKDKKYVITSLLMGVPHTVLFGKLSDFNVNEGEFIEKCSLFPEGTNVNFVEVINKDEVKVMTWERGAGATLACGTGCSATVVAGNKLNLLNKKVRVQAPGGVLIIELKDEKVFMTGKAEISFEGVCEI